MNGLQIKQESPVVQISSCREVEGLNPRFDITVLENEHHQVVYADNEESEEHHT